MDAAGEAEEKIMSEILTGTAALNYLKGAKAGAEDAAKAKADREAVIAKIVKHAEVSKTEAASMLRSDGKADMRKFRGPGHKPTTGQHATVEGLEWEGLSADGKAIMRKLVAADGPTRVIDLAIGDSDKATPSGARKRLLRARNALRRVVAAGWVVRAERGTYKATAKGKAGVK